MAYVELVEIKSYMTEKVAMTSNIKTEMILTSYIKAVEQIISTVNIKQTIKSYIDG